MSTMSYIIGIVVTTIVLGIAGSGQNITGSIVYKFFLGTIAPFFLTMLWVRWFI